MSNPEKAVPPEALVQELECGLPDEGDVLARGRFFALLHQRRENRQGPLDPDDYHMVAAGLDKHRATRKPLPRQCDPLSDSLADEHAAQDAR